MKDHEMKLDLTLPMPADAFIPHRPPMRLVDTLLSWEGSTGEIEATPSLDNILVGSDGILDEAALVELLAQGYATIKGYDDLLQGKPVSEGYLVGVRKVRLVGRPRAGEKLIIRIRTVGSFEGFAVADGEIERQGEIVASGTIKLWIVPPQTAEENA
jgi:3-hydroxyacyl-[acyl-carrier-protein] dehydratase